jgi:hypothetical protein
MKNSSSPLNTPATVTRNCFITPRVHRPARDEGIAGRALDTTYINAAGIRPAKAARAGADLSAFNADAGVCKGG